jgi:hypothetical protein
MTRNVPSSTAGAMPVEKSVRGLVLSYVEASNDEKFKLVRHYVSDDMKFDGALASLQGAEAIFTELERMRLKYDVKKSLSTAMTSASSTT